MQLSVFRSAVEVASFEIDENTVFQKELMGMDKIVANFYTSVPLDVVIGDYVTYEGSAYTVKKAPEAQKIDSTSFRYSIEFEGINYALYDKLVMHLGRTFFSYTGTPLELLQLVIDNLHELDLAWAIGDCALLEEIKTFTFNEQSCRTALTQIAEAWGLEYTFEGKDIYLISRVGTDQEAYIFQYGKGRGLYTLTRRTVDEPFATRWYGYGGSKNVPITYRDALGRITFDAGPYNVNTGLYGVKEGSVTFPEVFPSFTGSATTVPADNKITCTAIDFNINDLAVADGGAKIVFKTGDLGGNEFVITYYDHATKTITLGVIQDEAGYLLPNSIVKPAVGDLFTLTGIEMPSSYIEAAEAEVQARTIAHAEKNSHPKVAYELDINERFIRVQNLQFTLQPGDRVNVIDDDLAVNELIRVQSVEWPLVNPCAIKAVISEVAQYRETERIAKDLKDIDHELDETQASALYARQVADEIRNAAVMGQFQRTYVGERCVLSGAFVAGNPAAGQVAGINGAGTDLTEVRFWAGASYDDRATAPFRALQNGNVYMTAAEIRDGCKVGVFIIENGAIRTDEYVGGAGVFLDDGGILSRETGTRGIPASSGLDLLSSVFGVTTEEDYPTPGASTSPIRAAIIGLRPDDLTPTALDNIRYSRGTFGGFFSSIKNIGGQFVAIRDTHTASGFDNISYNDHIVVVVGNCTGVWFPNKPENGMHVRIQNRRSSNITASVLGFSADRIVGTDGAADTSKSVPSGEMRSYIYDGKRAWWHNVP